MEFKKYLESLDLNEYIRNNYTTEWSRMLEYKMPIKPGYFRKEPRKTVYRVAGVESARSIKQRQGRKNLLVGFTRGSTGLSQGYMSGSGVLYELDVQPVLSFDIDITTETDRNGYKWIESDVFARKMSIEITSSKELLKKIGYNSGYVSPQMIIKYLEADKDIPSKEAGKHKQFFIKWYYGISKKILNQYKDQILEELMKKYKGRYYSDLSNDEIVFNDYKVKGFWLISSSKPEEVTDAYLSWRIDDTKPLKKTGFKFKGFIYNQDILYIDISKGRTADKYSFANDAIKRFWEKL